MASKYNNLTRIYRVNIQRKNSVSRKQTRRGEWPSATSQTTKLTDQAPPAAIAPDTN